MKFGDNMFGIIMILYASMIVLVGINTNTEKLRYDWHIIPITIFWPISQFIK